MVVDLQNVSVVVPVFNSDNTIRKCIESLLKLDYPRRHLEIIFVDDGSEDNTKEIIKSYNSVSLIEKKHMGPAATRNTGFRNSSGKFIFFTDSDCIVPENWIKEMMKEFEENTGMAGGGLIPFSLRRSSERFEQNRREMLYGKKRAFVNYLPSCNLAVKRGVLEEVGGFDEDFKYPSFEDYDLCHRIGELGYKILYSPDIGVIHLHSSSWKGVFKRALMHGREGVKFSNKIGYPLCKDFLSVFKIFLLPAISIKNYSYKFMLVGILYDFINIMGKLSGIIKRRC